jgi:hypothetical protein
VLELCKKDLPDRSKYKEISEKKCYREKGHSGACAEFPEVVAFFETGC